ncbi:hypothetical protein ES703_49735 [subsurface metagenome]
MKLEKAIELLEEMPKVIDHQKLIDLPVAVKLGIEALKRLKLSRTKGEFVENVLLPGETEK